MGKAGARWSELAGQSEKGSRESERRRRVRTAPTTSGIHMACRERTVGCPRRPCGGALRPTRQAAGKTPAPLAVCAGVLAIGMGLSPGAAQAEQGPLVHLELAADGLLVPTWPSAPEDGTGRRLIVDPVGVARVLTPGESPGERRYLRVGCRRRGVRSDEPGPRSPGVPPARYARSRWARSPRAVASVNPRSANGATAPTLPGLARPSCGGPAATSRGGRTPWVPSAAATVAPPPVRDSHVRPRSRPDPPAPEPTRPKGNRPQGPRCRPALSRPRAPHLCDDPSELRPGKAGRRSSLPAVIGEDGLDDEARQLLVTGVPPLFVRPRAPDPTQATEATP
jgi:hypothetical protein